MRIWRILTISGKCWLHSKIPVKNRADQFNRFAETEIRDYLKDMVNKAVSDKKRLFLSHFTSTTHHPWGTPSDFKRQNFFAKEHTEMNDYLNAVRFVDVWLGELMAMFEDAGIANETLTVFVGDQYVFSATKVQLCGQC